MTTGSRIEIYVGNDNVLEVDGLRDGTTSVSTAGDYLNSQTGVVLQIQTEAGAVVSGATAISLSYVSGSSGKYRGTVPDTLALTARARYNGLLTADCGAGKLGYWNVQIMAVTRRQGD